MFRSSQLLDFYILETIQQKFLSSPDWWLITNTTWACSWCL
uniref:Uncharacterized protein n=1 Tax=Arundo donax TaxID=35708 RepID=A0A0A9DE62_ARUDO